MSERRRRVLFGRAADIAILVAFFGLSAFAISQVALGVGALVDQANEVEFVDLYQPGHNPWTGVMVAPATSGWRYASLSRLRHAVR